MATLADSLVSSSARKLAMRMRPDLSARQHRYQGRVYWVVKEPVGLNYFRFQEEEFAILRWLDGQTSLDELKEKFEEEFPPQKISVEELQQFLGMLHKSGLIIVGVSGQGYQLKKRRDERGRKELLSKFTNLLSMRFKGIDPDRLLNWLHPKVRFLFTRAGFACALVLAGAALGLVTVQFDVFQSKLPEFHQFFNLRNAIWLSIALGVTKILHEFGHGLACKHFGGECHEMGVMILVLTPCLYCNVSDSWMLPNKWHRAIIGAAGMYVELIIASICTFVWWFSSPGLLNHLALSTMFVCSVSTLMFNSNPLLRYDGYYILSDIVEIPNLRQKASDILNRKLSLWCLGYERPEDPFLPDRNQIFFALYSVAAALYRWIVVFSILWFLYQVWKPYRLEVIGQIIGIVALWGLFVQPIYKIAKFFYVPGRIEKVKKPRMYATLAVLAAVVAAFCYVPLPYRVYCTLDMQARDAHVVSVDVAGQLEEIFVRPGDRIPAGAKLARLSNIDLEIDIARFEGERDLYRAQLASLQRLQFGDNELSRQIPSYEANLESVERQLETALVSLGRLQLTAPIAGTIIPPASAKPPKNPEGELPEWSGTPFSPQNANCFLAQNSVFCEVGDPRLFEAHLVIDQSEIEFIREGHTVEIKLDELPFETLHGKIESIAQANLRVSPEALSNKAGGELATKTDESGIETPLSPSYEASVPLQDDRGLLRVGLKGRAKIHASWQPLGRRLWRYVTRTFHFRL